MVRKKTFMVSIITPVYNGEKYISKAIESVLSQTYSNWELLIADDSSSDNTEQIIKSYNDPRIKYYKNKSNCGAAKTRNNILEIAKGRFIAFLDADDSWKKQKLEKQLRFMIANNYAFTFTGYEIIGNKRRKTVSVPKKLNYSQFMKNTIIGTLTVIIDTNQIKSIRMVEVRKDHDSMTWARILRNGYNAYGLNETLANYNKVQGSISNDKFKAIKNHWTNCREIEKLSFIKCAYFFVFYIFNAIKKHYF